MTINATPYVLGLLRANGPCSVRGIRRELVTQCPGVDSQNVNIVARESLALLVASGEIEKFAEDNCSEAAEGDATYDLID